jgi:hypothetical protein
MSDLFTEALKDSKKLREIAEQDAKNAIVEAITPYIREMIAKEVSSPTDFFFEQEEEPGAEQQVVEPQTTQQPSVQPQATQPQPTEQAAAPLTPEGENVVNATMPDADGKITVNFEDLFIDDGSITLSKDQADKLAPVQVKGEQPAEEVAPAPEEEVDLSLDVAAQPVQQPVQTQQPVATESVSYNDYRIALGTISERIDHMFFTSKVSDLSRENVRQRLFDLLETVDLLREKGVIGAKEASIQENKLNFLFQKLKEAGLRNSYSINNNKDTEMKSLKEFAAKLFEEEQLALEGVNGSKLHTE